MKKIAIFASGNGSNAENIANYFSNKNCEISVILSNKKDAFVHERAKKLKIKSISFDRNTFYETQEIVSFLVSEKIDLIVLAGFLWLIPENLIKSFPCRIINIHPALLPKYGGKGMYGDHVHKAVYENKETKSGITIHYVSAQYDEGKIIFQESCELSPQDLPDDIAAKIHALEYKHFPEQIELILNKL